MVQAALQKAVGERRVQEAVLHVAVGNAPALRLYRRLGFTDSSLVEDYYGPVRRVVWHGSKFRTAVFVVQHRQCSSVRLHRRLGLARSPPDVRLHAWQPHVHAGLWSPSSGELCAGLEAMPSFVLQGRPALRMSSVLDPEANPAWAVAIAAQEPQ